MNTKATYKGQSCTVISKSGGWSTIVLDNTRSDVVPGGLSQKVRNSAVTVVETPKPAKAAKAPKAKKSAKVSNGELPPIRKKPAGKTRLVPDFARYTAHDAKTATGRKVYDINDKVAAALRGASLDDTYSIVAKAVGHPMTVLRARYEHLNPGMQRMNLGNLMRGHAKNKATA